MNRRRTFLLLFSATVAVLLVVLMIAYSSLQRFDRTHQAIRSGHLTLRVLESVLSSMKGAETALREYRELHDTTALVALADAKREVNMNLDIVGVLVTEKVQALRIDSLRSLTARAFLAVDPILREGVSPSDPVRQLAVDDALGLLRSSRGLYGRLVRAEEGVLKGSRDREQRISLSTPLLLLAFALLATVSLLFLKIYQASGKAQHAEQELKSKVDELASEMSTREFAERSLKRVLDSSVSGIMAFRAVRDKNGRIMDFEWIMANRQAELMLHKTGADLIGKGMLEVLPTMKGSGLFRQFIEVINTRKPLHLDNAADMNGLGARLDIHAVKLADGIVLTCTDVSDRQRQQAILRESERLALTGKIARTVAHEVRNPLTNVLLALDQLKEEEDITALQPLTEIIRRNVDRIAHLITEMLDSSKPREVIRTPCDIGIILNGTVELVRDRLELRHMELVVDLAPGMPLAELDRGEIELALTNIIINSIEAMEQGTGRLIIRATHGRGNIQVTIEDNGHGIAEEDLSRLFDPFYTGRPDGMGLGLTTARSILNSHGVHVDVTSKVGSGTRFTLTFPGVTVPTAAIG